jgi:hypothetical protein
MQDVKATLEFTSAQVQEILVQYVKENYPLLRESVTINNVSFSVSAGFSGHGGSSPCLNHAKVEVKLKQSK